MSTYNVSSEIYNEKEYQSSCLSKDSEQRISRFYYTYPLYDEDGDLIVSRKSDSSSQSSIEIAHSSSTNLKLVGLQIWRGALLLSDFILSFGDKLENKTLLELGSGVGLTSIVASKLCSQVICTDIDEGGILELISSNFQRNQSQIKAKYSVLKFDFFEKTWSKDLEDLMENVDIVLAADVIYDNDITDAFIQSLERILASSRRKEIFIALEKRYVFTISDLDSVAPCYEHFQLRLSEMLGRNCSKNWKSEQLDINFPQFFKYDRVKHLVLWKVWSE